MESGSRHLGVFVSRSKLGGRGGRMGGLLLFFFNEKVISGSASMYCIYGKKCCGSRMIIPEPCFYPSRIQKQQQKRRREKNRSPF
jgi:hypothetical protein